MRVEIVTIGDELLLGFTLDTNAAHLARELAGIGVEVVRRTTVGDVVDDIVSAVSDGLARTGAVITTGGLGPTADDLTVASIATLFGRGLQVDDAHVAWMRERWRSRFGRDMPESNIKQAMVPDGARMLRNNHGSAPGVLMEDDRGRWVVTLPGVPREMRGMCTDSVIPMLRARMADRGRSPSVIASRSLRTTGVPESLLADRVAGVASELDGVATAYLPGIDGVDLRLTVRGFSAEESERRLASAEDRLRAVLGDDAYAAGVDGADTLDLPALVVGALRNRHLTLAVAESCTGGLLGARVTAVAGASDVFLGGAIAYANTVKTAMLGVDPRSIERDGSVSEAVVRQMAAGARERTGASIGVGITGVAGPAGGTAAKPVGTVWLGFDFEGTVEAVQLTLWGNREEVRHRATQAALDILRRRLAAS